ncbi:MAG: hypothetical protein QHJ73_00150 [Armatimonadota bacterium]|nr:hypothetical protein [Armatimonadota bacterium]
MRPAIAAARRGIVAGQSPFGVCIGREGRIVSLAHYYREWNHTAATGHAEKTAIRPREVRRPITEFGRNDEGFAF